MILTLMDRTTLYELVSAICFLELIGDLCSRGHVFPGHKQELTFRSLDATLAVGPVLITFVETFCHIFGRPFDK